MKKPKLNKRQVAGCLLSGAVIPSCTTALFIVG
jgi:hypothetical protein